ncbi:uncharacterized protein LOC115444166 [Manduca sexta]|uniref:Uncharacterized protein n=1 Tax=Manduca sexta TaxID=7130 RepID=A0A921Z4M5_MANSE|nr:uncharacterized protein LOC115444166 [Manduca sexta]KAG6451058.1 hypothetical protein O3G_MSEX006919 [Manduca sexta]
MFPFSNLLIVLAVLFCVYEINALTAIESGSKSKVLSRRKRYVAFPEGSSFSIAGCMVTGLIGQPAPATAPGTFTFGLNWAIAYELPNATETAAFYTTKKYKKPLAQRRSRRELYEKLEKILDNMGYSGRQCILKTLCETTQRIVPHGDNMMTEMFRSLFTLPMVKVLTSEPLEHTIYDSAHRLGVMLENCDNMFHCPISLVDLAKGYYNAPSPGVDTMRSPWALFSSNFG